MAAETVIQVRFDVPESSQDALLADLFERGFEGFEQRADALIGFVPESVWPAARKAVEQLTSTSHPCRWEAETIEPRNWNEEWERGIEPVAAGPFLIHPPWHVPPAGVTAICIEPKMSFGTGHHETTRLVLSLLAPLVRGGERVLDAGAGTGVLAIAAALLGAVHVDGFDIDPWSVENGAENTARNDVDDRVVIVEGGIEAAPEGPYDVILANINRNVLLGLLSGFRDRLTPGGHLVLSGVLQTDREVMHAALGRAGFRLVEEAVEGEWLALVAQ